MLQVQVSHEANVETRRHNLEQERQGRASISESKRHNVQQEAIGFGNLAETNRHNVEGEGISWFNANENARHNIVAEGFQNRANELREGELREKTIHDQNMEDVEKYNAETKRGEMAETNRHNKQMEGVALMNANTNTANAYTNAAAMGASYGRNAVMNTGNWLRFIPYVGSAGMGMITPSGSTVYEYYDPNTAKQPSIGFEGVPF